MTTGEVKLMIESVGIPSAYYKFKDNTRQQPPFICFFYGDSTDEIADNINYVRKVPLYVELYTDVKDIDLETRVETALNSHELVYMKQSVYIDSERMHETIYTTELILEV